MFEIVDCKTSCDDKECGEGCDYGSAFEVGAEAQKKHTLQQVIEWGNEDCPHAGSVNGMTVLHKHDCYTCWAELEKEAK